MPLSSPESPQTLLDRASPVIADRLFFLSTRCYLHSDAEFFCWTADHDLVYDSYEADFGPLNLSMLVRFCRSCYRYLNDPELGGKKLIFYSSHNGHKRANAGYLITSFCVLVLGESPEEAWGKISGSYPPLLPYRDVGCGVSTYNCTIPHCLEALKTARDLRWVDWRRFDVDEYEHFEQPAHGDFNWIVPGRMLAFSAPMGGSGSVAPSVYAKLFKERGVTGVVRLCRKTYDREVFVTQGIAHTDLIFPDGSTPTDSIVTRFLDFVESCSPGAVAVHCKAGLGRTGTLVGCNLINSYGFTAKAAIAWLRICRPGSVIGPQQHFLLAMEPRLKRREVKGPSSGYGSTFRAGSPSPLKKRLHAADKEKKPPAPCSSDRQTSELLKKSRALQVEIDEILAGAAAASPQAAVAPPPASAPAAAAAPAAPAACRDLSKRALKNLRAIVIPHTLVHKTAAALMRVLGYEGDHRVWVALREKLGTAEMGKRVLRVRAEAEGGDPQEVLRRVEGYVSCGEHRPSAVGKVSKDAMHVSAWLHSVASLCRCSLMAVSPPQGLPSLPHRPVTAAPPPSLSRHLRTTGAFPPRSAGCGDSTATPGTVRLIRPQPSLIFT